MGFTFPADNEDKDKDNAGPAEETAAAEGQEEEQEQEEMTLENLSREKGTFSGFPGFLVFYIKKSAFCTFCSMYVADWNRLQCP